MGKKLRIILVVCLFTVLGTPAAVTPNNGAGSSLEESIQDKTNALRNGCSFEEPSNEATGTWSSGRCKGNPSDC